MSLSVTKTNGSSVTVSVTNTSGTGSVITLGQQLQAQINNTPEWQAADGLYAGDSGLSYTTRFAFMLYARSPGLGGARLQVKFNTSTNLSFSQIGLRKLDENLEELAPRNHLYLAVGVTNLEVAFTLDTTQLPDGDHELVAVGYAGDSVRTQTVVRQKVRVSNTPLLASLDSPVSQGMAALTDTLPFTVTANTNAIATIELFSTGGSWGVVSNQPSASFSIAATNLGAGLHPFFALITDTYGHQYRTATQFIRLSPAPMAMPFPLRVSHPLTLTWPGLAGHTYDILSGTNATSLLQLRDSVVVTNTGWAEWTEPQPTDSMLIYRVRTQP